MDQVSYQRITVTLMMFMVIAVCFNNFNPSVLKLAYVVDFGNRTWSGLIGNNSYRNENILNNSVMRRLNYTYERNSSATTKNIYLPNKAKQKEAYLPTSAKQITTIPNPQTQAYVGTTTSRMFVPEDLMKKGPFMFLRDYKNPCWKAYNNYGTHPLIRCLPYFYLIGAPKSGTTDMQRRLVQHPDISELVVKEPHWLTRKHYYDRQASTLTDYLNYFTRAANEIIMQKNSRGYHRKIFGDCSASTMWDNNYWTTLPEYKNLSEPLYTNADYIYHLNPNTKIMVLLRNPVERCYSDYLCILHGNPKQFHTGVYNAIRDTHKCLNTNSLRQCLYNPSKHLSNVQGRLLIGVYHLHLKEYLRVFPRDQVMVIKLEDFSIKPLPYMRKIFEFLNITNLDENDLKRIANADQHANRRTKEDRKVGDMLPKTRKLLEDFYRPHNELLTELLGSTFSYNRNSS